MNKDESIKISIQEPLRHNSTSSNASARDACARYKSDRDCALISIDAGVQSLTRRNGGDSFLQSVGKDKTVIPTGEDLGIQTPSLIEPTSQQSSRFGFHAMAKTAQAIVNARASAKGQAQFANARKQYYRKAIALMVVGGLFFTAGVALAVLHFARFEGVQIAGPICLAVGLLLSVCGLVWIPIIKTKLRRNRQMMSRTFNTWRCLDENALEIFLFFADFICACVGTYSM